MSDARTQMIAALKAIVIPRLRERRFVGGFPHFQRRGETVTDLVSFQFDRHGVGVVLELGQCERGFKVIWPNQVEVRGVI